jgi:hypothetical protein
MEGQYITLICVGGVYILLFLIFVIDAINTKRYRKDKDKSLKESYKEENIRKMEYDLALYDEDERKPVASTTVYDGQVTIDEVLDKKTDDAEKSDDALFTKVNTDGMEEITGNFTQQ